MNKKVKYILGYIAILILALVCTFGFIKYNQIKNNKQENNSQNLGSVDGKQVDKETTIIIEKLSQITDVDSLNSELKLPDIVVSKLKKYAPTVSYAIDNSEGQEKLLLCQGGYYAGIEDGNVGVNEIIGAYKISKGNLESTNEDLQLVGAKYSDKNDLK